VCLLPDEPIQRGEVCLPYKRACLLACRSDQLQKAPTSCRATYRNVSQPLWRCSQHANGHPIWIVDSFHIDHKALAEHGDLDMTEKRIRTLEKTGFIDPVVTAGSSYKPTVAGVHRKPIQFSSEYVPLFIPSKRWAVAVRDRHSEAAWSFSGVGYQPSGVSGLRRSSNA
jgi:hypothetical protein